MIGVAEAFDMAVPVLRMVMGLLFFLFVPGGMVVLLFFEDRSALEKLMLAIVFSIMAGLSIGVFFGYDRAQAAMTGGFTPENLWMGEFALTTLLGVVVILKRTFMKRSALQNGVKSVASQETKDARSHHHEHR